ncbi:MAG TPA: hypothetical protein VGP46_09755, partial [Acidimicrobiales bacterium]|nr:hypothetical protein [Acidimicrobiales bacterium]
GGDFALYDGGHGRTVVKLPLGWESRPITGLRLLAYPSGGSGKPAVKDIRVTVIGLTDEFAVVRAPHPSPAVITQG